MFKVQRILDGYESFFDALPDGLVGLNFLDTKAWLKQCDMQGRMFNFENLSFHVLHCGLTGC
jgi:hypothetical protein